MFAPKNFGEVLKSLAEKNNMIQADFVRITGRSQVLVYDWFIGRTRPNDTDTMVIAKKFGIDPDAFLAMKHAIMLESKGVKLDMLKHRDLYRWRDDIQSDR